MNSCRWTLIGALAMLPSIWATVGHAENAEFRERLAAWQSPRGGGRVAKAAYQEEIPSLHVTASQFVDESIEAWTGPAEGACCGGNACGPACQENWDWCGAECGPRLWWMRKEGLLWWRKGRELPILVTTSTTPVPPPGTTVLFGGETFNSSVKIGGRLDFGTWLGCDECVGIGGRFWGLENENRNFAVNSADLPGQTIERPFIQSPATPNSLVVADPFTPFAGNVNVSTSSETFGADAYVRIRCGQNQFSRTDFITGYQFARINESLAIHSDTQSGTLVVDDLYRTYNEFHGGILGVMHTTACNCWDLELGARVALGNIHQTVVASGTTNNQTGGLLVEANSTIIRDQFCSLPELSATCSCQLSPCMRLHLGYTFMYWSNVARPEEVIDPVRGNGVSIVLNDSSFWVQGINAGMTYTW